MDLRLRVEERANLQEARKDSAGEGFPVRDFGCANSPGVAELHSPGPVVAETQFQALVLQMSSWTGSFAK